MRYACDKLHFIALKAHFIFFVGIHICHWGGRNLGGIPLWYDTLAITQTPHIIYFILMRFQAAALLAALALVSACDGRLKIPNERPDRASTAGVAAVLHSRPSCQEWGCGDGSAVIASRRMLRGKSSKAQHLSEAMLVAIASFAFAGAAVLAIVSGGKGGIGESGDQGGGGTGSGGGGGAGGDGGRPHQRRGFFPALPESSNPRLTSIVSRR